MNGGCDVHPAVGVAVAVMLVGLAPLIQLAQDHPFIAGGLIITGLWWQLGSYCWASIRS